MLYPIEMSRVILLSEGSSAAYHVHTERGEHREKHGLHPFRGTYPRWKDASGTLVIGTVKRSKRAGSGERCHLGDLRGK